MPSPTPTLEAVLTAIQTEIDAVNFATGSVIVTAPKFESELEGIEAYKQAGDGSIDLWRVSAEAVDEIEGDAPGEAYSIYQVLCEYWNVREGDANWEKTGRQQVETIRDRLNGNANVFRPSGQVQLQTPETASVEGQGFEFVEDQLVFKAAVSLRVEARRWS